MSYLSLPVFQNAHHQHKKLGCAHMYRRLMYTCTHKTLEYMSRFANNFYQAFHLKLSLPDLLRHALVMHWYRFSSGCAASLRHILSSCLVTRA